MAFVVALAAIGACDHGRSFWLQPQYETCVSTKAWCYPTAAASLLAYYKDKWDSAHTLMYPDTYYESPNSSCTTELNQVVSQVSWGPEPWADYAYHESNTELSLGASCLTNISTGTTLANGASGIRNFTGAEVTVIEPNGAFDIPFLSAHAPPYLLHIKQSCAASAALPSPPDGDAPAAATITVGDTSPANTLGSTLGHTAVAWEWTSPTMLVASNSPNERSGTNRTCMGTLYTFTASSSCVEAITTVSWPDDEDDADWKLIAIVAGAVVGGILMVVGVRYYVKPRGVVFLGGI